jgi:hypothetical protein
MLKNALNIIYNVNQQVIVIFNHPTQVKHWKSQDWLQPAIGSNLLHIRATGPDINWELFTIRGVPYSSLILFDHDVLEHQFSSVFDKWSQFIGCTKES